MWEPIGPLITAIKNAGPRIYAAALVATLLLLFLPESIISHIGFAEFRQSYRVALGLVFIASASLLVVHAIPAIAPVVVSPWKRQLNRRTDLKRLADLTHDEKAFLRPYILDDENTRHALITSGVVKGLVAKGLLYRASKTSAPGGGFPYNMQPTIRSLLKKRPHLLN
jgi:hypothetical protein